jgi:hypothetical protein
LVIKTLVVLYGLCAFCAAGTTSAPRPAVRRHYAVSVRDTLVLHSAADYGGISGAVTVSASKPGCTVEHQGDRFIFFARDTGVYRILFKSRSTGSEVADTAVVSVTDRAPEVRMKGRRVQAVLGKGFRLGFDIRDDGPGVVLAVDLDGDRRADTVCTDCPDPLFRFKKPTRKGEVQKRITARYIVKDNDAHRVKDSIEIVLRYEPPRAEAGPNLIVCRDKPAALSGAASRDDNGRVARYLWDFDGDGSADTVVSTPAVERAFTAVRDYYTVLWVEDDLGNLSKPDTVVVSVMRDKPSASAGPPALARAGPTCTAGRSLRSVSRARITAGSWWSTTKTTAPRSSGRSPWSRSPAESFLISFVASGLIFFTQS